MKWCHNSKLVKELISPQFYLQSLWKQINFCAVKINVNNHIPYGQCRCINLQLNTLSLTTHLAQVRNVIFVKTNILCNFQEVWDPVHSCDELPVYVQSLLAVFLIHVKILFCKNTKYAQRISYTSISLSTPLVHEWMWSLHFFNCSGSSLQAELMVDGDNARICIWNAEWNERMNKWMNVIIAFFFF